MNGLIAGVMEVVMALIGIALIALLIGNASKTSQLIQTGGDTLAELLKVVTLQNGMTMG